MNTRHPLILKSVLVYFIALGVTGLVWPFLDLGPNRAGFSAHPSYLTPAYVLHQAVAVGYIVAAIAIAQRRSWAFRLTFYVLVISTFQFAKSFAWGFASGRPSIAVYCFSMLVFLTWHVFLGQFVYRNCNGSNSTLR